MIDPVPRGIRGEGKVIYGIFVILVIELEENTEASLCKDGMGRFRKNVVV
jgi:hypothetical protein